MWFACSACGSRALNRASRLRSCHSAFQLRLSAVALEYQVACRVDGNALQVADQVRHHPPADRGVLLQVRPITLWALQTLSTSVWITSDNQSVASTGVVRSFKRAPINCFQLTL